MNSLKRYLPILLLSLINSSCTITENTNNTKDPRKAAAGYIKVREADGVRECSIPTLIDPGDTYKDYAVDRWGCTNDQAYTVRFVDVPSALNITFFSDKENDYCKEEGRQDWVIEVRTIKEPTTTPEDYISIAAMANVPDNTLVVPGVLKIRLVHRRGDYNGKLSCVRVENNK
jgi:hypothetical protein